MSFGIEITNSRGWSQASLVLDPVIKLGGEHGRLDGLKIVEEQRIVSPSNTVVSQRLHLVVHDHVSAPRLQAHLDVADRPSVPLANFFLDLEQAR